MLPLMKTKLKIEKVLSGSIALFNEPFYIER